MLLLNTTLTDRLTLQRRALVCSICTTLVLFIFQPFGTYESELSFKYLRLAGYGFVTFFAVFVAGMIEIELSKHQHRIRFYSLLIISLYMVIIALFNHSYFVVAISERWYWLNQLMFLVYVTAIAIFPVTIIYLLEITGAKSLSDQQAAQNTPSSTPLNATETKTQAVQAQIVGENKSDVLTLSLIDIVFIKSADNYCEIVARDGGSISTHLLRISLSKVLAQLPENNIIVRCHRSYGVNLSLVVNWQGNANGLKLEMKHSDTAVPVSRAYVDVIKRALSVTPKSS